MARAESAAAAFAMPHGAAESGTQQTRQGDKVERYRLIYAANPDSAEAQMNELAQQGYSFAGISGAGGGTDHVFVVMEFTGAREVGGRAGTVADEALLAGIPSQGPTAERQLSEEALGAGSY